MLNTLLFYKKSQLDLEVNCFLKWEFRQLKLHQSDGFFTSISIDKVISAQSFSGPQLLPSAGDLNPCAEM